MQFDFLNSGSLSKIQSHSIVFVLTKEMAANSKNDFVKFAKDHFEFDGSFGKFNIGGKYNNSLVFVAGIGAEKDLDEKKLQEFGGSLNIFLSGQNVKDASILLCDVNENGDLVDFVSGIDGNLTFGILVNSYRFNKYFTGKKQEGKTQKIRDYKIFHKDFADIAKKHKELEIMAKNIFFVRDLVSEPSNELNPESYAEICKNLNVAGLEVEILDEKKILELGMGSLYGVAKGSQYQPRVVILKYFGADNKNAAPIAFVGKGVTFDTGGISIKPSQNMEDMKTDMTGSAVVVGLLKLLAERKAKINAIGAIGLVENMPSHNAQKPGDVVKTYSGQTIEVINTDAEGRLVLADVLYYTQEQFKPSHMIDLATLTGAIIVSLSDKMAGLFANNDELAENLIKAGKKTGEELWRMPLSKIGEGFDKAIDSQIADMLNTSTIKGAGSTTAAQLLQRFVGDTKWAHLDIAGVAWNGKGDAFATKGATGFGIRLLNKFVEDFCENCKKIKN